MTDTTPRTEQEKGWEEERKAEMKKALTMRRELEKIEQAKKALEKKEAAAKAAIKKGERILDTNAKCALAGCILGALKSGAVDSSVVSALVGILDHGLKPRDRRLIVELYGKVLPGLPGEIVEVSTITPPPPSIASQAAAVSPPGTGTAKPTDLQHGKEILFGKKEEPAPVETMECPGKVGEKCFNILTVRVAQKPEHAGKRFVKCDSCGFFKWLDG